VLNRARNMATILASCAFLATGCGGSGLVSVKGFVTLDGKPLEGATVIFVPAAGEVVTSTGAGLTDDLGRFELTTTQEGDGIRPGTYRVTISKKDIPERPRMTMDDVHDKKAAMEYAKQMRSQSSGPIKYITPIDYADQNKTPFKGIKVPPDGPVQLDLKSDFKYHG
jgi:hypothetical protein